MLIDEYLSDLQKYTKEKITYEKIASVIKLKGKQAVGMRIARKQPLKDWEIELLDNEFKKKKDSSISTQSNTACAAKINDVIKIPYWEGLPDELKHIEYTYVLAQRASIEQGWNLSPESLCITVMNGDAMENYWYKIRNNDVLIIDTSETKVNANGCGVYFATSRNNSMFWIREMQMLYNGDIEFHSYSPSGTKARILTQEQLKENDFKIIGKVIKNVSFRL